MISNNKTVSASLVGLKTSTIKLVPVARLVRGLSVSEAIALLAFSKLKVASHLSKLIFSAASNAENNFGMNIDSMIIRRVEIGRSYYASRLVVRGRGRINRVRKPFSRVSVVLG